MTIFRDTGQNLQSREKRRVEATREFRLRSLAKHQNILGVAAGDERFLQSRQQSHQKNGCGHRKRNAQGRHDRQPLAKL